MIYDLRRGLDWIRHGWIAETQEVTLLHTLGSLSLSRRFDLDLHTHTRYPARRWTNIPQGAPPEKARPHHNPNILSPAQNVLEYVNSVRFIARNRRGLACAEQQPVLYPTSPDDTGAGQSPARQALLDDGEGTPVSTHKWRFS